MIDRIIDEINDDFRNPESVQAEEQRHPHQSVLKRAAQTGLDMAQQMMGAAELAARMKYADKINDKAMYEFTKIGRMQKRMDKEKIDRDAVYEERLRKAEEIERDVKSPSSPDVGIEY